MKKIYWIEYNQFFNPHHGALDCETYYVGLGEVVHIAHIEGSTYCVIFENGSEEVIHNVNSALYRLASADTTTTSTQPIDDLPF